jgi:hypothetical protein
MPVCPYCRSSDLTRDGYNQRGRPGAISYILKNVGVEQLAAAPLGRGGLIDARA